MVKKYQRLSEIDATDTDNHARISDIENKNNQQVSRKRRYSKANQSTTHSTTNEANQLLEKAQQLKKNKNDGADTNEPTIMKAGRLTAIAVQKKNKQRFNLFIDGQFAIGIGEATLVHFALSKGQLIDEELLNQIKTYDHCDYAYQVGLNYLTHKLRSKKEVNEKLQEQDFSEDAIHFAINKLTNLHLIDDDNYGRSYVRTEMRAGKKGSRVIARDLRKKGLSDDLIQDVLTEFDTNQEWGNAYSMGEKYFDKQIRKHSVRDSVQRVKTHLLSKGYNHDMVNDVVQRIEQSTDDLSIEHQALHKEADKLWRKHRQLTDKERTFKVKGKLMQKGYDIDEINSYLEEKVTND